MAGECTPPPHNVKCLKFVIHSFYNLPYFYLDGISSKIPWTLNNIKTRILNWKYTRLCEAFWIPSQSIYTERYFGNLNFPEADKRKVFIFKHYNLYWIWRVGVIRQVSICKNWFPSLILISVIRCNRDHILIEGSPVVSSSLYDISRRLTFERWNIVVNICGKWFASIFVRNFIKNLWFCM